MPNNYKSFYLKDITTLIDQVAVDIMLTPCIRGKFNGEPMTQEELSTHNGLIAMHNDGIREMAKMLKIKLAEEADDD